MVLILGLWLFATVRDKFSLRRGWRQSDNRQLKWKQVQEISSTIHQRDEAQNRCIRYTVKSHGKTFWVLCPLVFQIKYLPGTGNPAVLSRYSRIRVLALVKVLLCVSAALHRRSTSWFVLLLQLILIQCLLFSPLPADSNTKIQLGLACLHTHLRPHVHFSSLCGKSAKDSQRKKK